MIFKKIQQMTKKHVKLPRRQSKLLITSLLLFIFDIIKWTTSQVRLVNLSPFKVHDFRLLAQQTENQLLGKSLSQMHTLVYRGK